MQRPVLEHHEGVAVIRDDLLPGGTKSRFLMPYLKGIDAGEVVYAGPAQGGAQVALAITAYQAGKQATLFVPARKERTPYTGLAELYGARIIEVSPGYLSVLKARAAEYCRKRGAHLLPFGLDMPEAIEEIAKAALSLDVSPNEVWCAAGSGVLAKALAKAWPNARICAVEVGKAAPKAAYSASIPFDRKCPNQPPFPSNPYYDAKAWQECLKHKVGDGVLFWNVAA
ncbi:pyridoxal-phosphate dependent enzyme [Thalassospira xiamenensis]|uniref:Tryptophan synthase beta chain-like PALP domain-containing protein n=1 Tax=Thalassospira xiamenensis TaxID=220697 RepID=A0A367XHT7_9PROT|nr:pyridoxal-phosphate dependent enzyme [Thalassospira xiamenensis]KZB51141.1 hypothetical protein AUP41_08530 [Thalassospira xiamenensis]RCK53215.1 hypothetical protein TH44_03225 [Thalassospira xiamenensis]